MPVASLNQVFASGSAPCADFSFFGPHGLWLASNQTFMSYQLTVALDRAGAPGPASYHGWMEAWKVIRTSRLLFKVAMPRLDAEVGRPVIGALSAGFAALAEVGPKPTGSRELETPQMTHGLRPTYEGPSRSGVVVVSDQPLPSQTPNDSQERLLLNFFAKGEH